MAGTFAAWLAAPARREVVLCELEPSITLTGWTNVGGSYPTTYAITVARFVQTARITGGLYRRVLGVQEDETVLSAAADLAGVEAAAGSYWWAEATDTLYVHTTGDADPDTLTLLQASVRLFLANTPVVLETTSGDPTTAVYHHPWLTDDLPQIHRQVEDLLSGTMVIPSGRVSFTNGHGAWFELVAPEGAWNWKHKPVRFLIGGSYQGLDLARDAYEVVATMVIEDVAPTDTICTFSLQPLQRFAEIELPVTPYFEDTYPDLGDGVRGTKQWIGYGRAIVPPDLTDASGNGVYTLADAARQTLFAVAAVWAVAKVTGEWTLLTPTTHYTVDLTACTVSVVSATYHHRDYTLAVDVTGKPDGVGGYLQTYADIVRDLLETFVGVGASALDTAAFAVADLEAEAELAMWVKSPRVLASLLATSEVGLASLGRSVMGTTQQTIDGQWTVRIWNPNVDAIDTSLRQADFATFTPAPKLRMVYTTVRVYYNYDHARQQWSAVEASDAAALYRTGSRDVLEVFTFLTTPSVAETMAARYLLLTGGITVEAEFQERGALLAQHEAGDKTLVTYTPAPTLTGAYDAQPFEVLSSDLTLAPKLTVVGRLGNLRGLGGRVGRWMESGAPDWTTAISTERVASGFWCDSAGLADAGDPLSANRSIWW